MLVSGEELRQRRSDLGISQARLSELSGVDQHKISAYELGKSSLDSVSLGQVSEVVLNSSDYQKSISRKKRYRSHSYEVNRRDAARAARVQPTAGNLDYRIELGQLLKKANGDLSAISLFSGIGGLSLGFEAAGYKMAGFCELSDELAEIYKANFPGTERLGCDVSRLDPDKLRSFCERMGPIDVIVGGPPCQGFSLSGKRSIEDPRNYLFQEYMKIVDIVRPRVVVVENVRLLTSMKSKDGGFVRDHIISDLESHGYRAKLFEIDAADYGVPQNRQRVFFIGVRRDQFAEPSFPEKDHSNSADLFDVPRRYRTFADACSDLAYLESGDVSNDPMHVAVQHPDHVVEWLWDVQEGSSAHENEDPALRPPSGYNTTYKRQIWLEPAATVQTTFGMISGCRNVHPIATRSLTVREAARIQTFPDDFVLRGSMGTIRTGIGNAVPPLLAKKIALHLRSSLFDFVKIASLKVEL